MKPRISSISKTKLFPIGVVVALTIFTIFTIFTLFPKKVVDSDYVSPEIGSISEIVEGTGSLSASGVTYVYSPTKGIIKQMFVENGMSVNANEKLFEVTSSSTEQEKASALAGLLAARSATKNVGNSKLSLQSQLESARKAIIDATNAVNKMNENITNQKDNPATGKSYTDAEKLSIQSALISANSSFKSIESEYLAAEDSILSAKSSLALANVVYQATKDSITKSPVAGTIYNLKKNVGDSVGVMADGEPVLILANADLLTILFQVSEYSVGKISQGQEVQVTFDALPGLSIKGLVDEVDTLGNSNLGTVKYGVVVRLFPSVEEMTKLRPAMTANLTIYTNSKDNVLTVPRSALKLYSGNYSVVKIINGKGAESVVQVGVLGVDRAEIISGLNKNDKIKRLFSL